MKEIPAELQRIAQRQQGVIDIADLTRFGVTSHERKTWLRKGVISGVCKGVYRFGTALPNFGQRCRIALAAVPDAVLSGATCGRIYRLRKLWTEDVHLLAHRTVSSELWTSHKTDFLTDEHITHINRFRVLTADRLLCDLAWTLDEHHLESVLEQMLDDDLTTMPAVRSTASEFRRRGRPGATRIARLLKLRPTDLPPAESDLELRLWRALAAEGFELERQYPIELPTGTTVRVDLADPNQRIAIEVDHSTFHSGRLDVVRDKRRDRGLRAVGWDVVRVTENDINDRLHETVTELAMILRRSA